MGFFASLGGWNWFILGGVLLVAEVVAPGAAMLWLGLAALATGLVVMAAAPPLAIQIAIFGVLSLVALLVWRKLRRSADNATDAPFLNRRADILIGREFTLAEPISNGHGAVKIEDSRWRISGPDMPGGARVRVVGVDGSTLKVEAV